jgi:hypothetical protein
MHTHYPAWRRYGDLKVLQILACSRTWPHLKISVVGRSPYPSKQVHALYPSKQVHALCLSSEHNVHARASGAPVRRCEFVCDGAWHGKGQHEE